MIPGGHTLWHYTCDHAHLLLGRSGTLLPGCMLNGVNDLRHDGGVLPFQTSLCWMTDLGLPIREALGLSSVYLTCDRTQHRYRVLDDSDVVAWLDVRRAMVQRGMRDAVEDLEAAPGARPRHWYVATAPVPVEYDPVRIVSTH